MAADEQLQQELLKRSNELYDEKVGEASLLGGPYARQAGAWVDLPASGIDDAPSDGKIYVRRNGAWEELVIS